MMIGEKIRSIRKSKDLTIVEFSEKINVTSGYISQIERDLISPSLTVLKRMADALEIPLSVLFLNEADENVVIIPREERTKVKFGSVNVELEFLTPVLKNTDKLTSGESFVFKIPPKSWVSDNTIMNDAKTLVFVLKGKMEYHIGEKRYMVTSGDSICIPENNGHLVFNPDEEEITEALCTLIPASRN